MAIWQLSFQLIPIDGSHYDEHTLLSNKSTAILSEELPPNVGWCTEDKVFGCLDTTCVEICFIDSAIDEISVRLDISSLRTKQINSIVNFAIANHLQILYNEKKLSVSMENICSIIRDSDAFHYLNNPKQFLTQLSQSHNDRFL